MADFDGNGRVLGVILGGIAAGMTGTGEIHAAMARELIERRAADLSDDDLHYVECLVYKWAPREVSDRVCAAIDAWRKAEARRTK